MVATKTWMAESSRLCNKLLSKKSVSKNEAGCVPRVLAQYALTIGALGKSCGFVATIVRVSKQVCSGCCIVAVTVSAR